jgi:hypothetical protein
MIDWGLYYPDVNMTFQRVDGWRINLKGISREGSGRKEAGDGKEGEGGIFGMRLDKGHPD